jgi:tight adherence protein C
MSAAIYLGVFATMFFLVALGAIFWKTPMERLAVQRLNSAVKEVGGSNAPPKVATNVMKEQFGELLVSFSQWMKATAGATDNPKMQERFTQAGIKNRSASDYYFAARILAPASGVLLGSFSPWNPFMIVIMLGGLGYLAPDFWLERKIKARRERIRKSLPEVMDLLYVCVDAGLGMDQAMIRVAAAMSESHADMHDEIMRLGREQRAGKPRLAAWKAMADRTGLPDVESFVSMLVQTERFGTPIAKALAMFSDDLRLKRRQLAEERAAKTTVKMIFPLVLFIFPSIFIVLLGPAFLSIGKSLSGLGQ